MSEPARWRAAKDPQTHASLGAPGAAAGAIAIEGFGFALEAELPGEMARWAAGGLRAAQKRRAGQVRGATYGAR